MGAAGPWEAHPILPHQGIGWRAALSGSALCLQFRQLLKSTEGRQQQNLRPHLVPMSNSPRNSHQAPTQATEHSRPQLQSDGRCVSSFKPPPSLWTLGVCPLPCLGDRGIPFLCPDPNEEHMCKIDLCSGFFHSWEAYPRRVPSSIMLTGQHFLGLH